MKTIQFITIFIILLMSNMTASAQELELTNGAYEKKEVVEVEGASVITLYERAIEALSDWTGPDSKSSAGIDYSEKETGTVIYKGKFSLGFKNVFMGNGWNRFANFTLKVKCKDGRAQITVTIPTMLSVYNDGNFGGENTIEELVKAVKMAKGKKKERGIALIETLKEGADLTVEYMKRKLQAPVDDDF